MQWTTKLAGAARWLGTALPLVICLTMWILGRDGPIALLWLHRFIGIGMLAWTGMRLARRASSAGLRPRRAAQRPVSLVILYGLLVLQPVLAVAGHLLQGEPVAFGGVVLPALLPANAAFAHLTAELHGWNAILLLVLVAGHVAAEWGRGVPTITRLRAV